MNAYDRFFPSTTQLHKGALRSETYLTTKSPLKMMKSAYYFILKALFVLKIFKLLS